VAARWKRAGGIWHVSNKYYLVMMHKQGNLVVFAEDEIEPD
jgi:hypothetical protein